MISTQWPTVYNSSHVSSLVGTNIIKHLSERGRQKGGKLSHPLVGHAAVLWCNRLRMKTIKHLSERGRQKGGNLSHSLVGHAAVLWCNRLRMKTIKHLSERGKSKGRQA